MMIPPGQVAVILALALAPCGEDGRDRPPSPGPAVSQEPATPQDPFADLTVVEAQGLARMLDKHVLVAFYAEDCPACDTLDATTFADPQVRAWLEERVMAVRLRPGDDHLTARWRVGERPTLLFLTWQDEELAKQEKSLVDTFKLAGMTVILPDPNAFRAPVLAKVPKMFESKWGAGTFEAIQAIR